jgi:ABC-type polysaccharide/polyol phosphate transport system ATPase subunit
MKIVIEAKDVTVSYRHYESATRSIKLNLLMNHKSQKQKRFAIQNLSIQISAGEIIGDIGNNGAGKSTLAKLVVGSVKPLTGWIRTEGVVTAMIELGAGINMDMTPRENVKLHSAIYGSPLSKSDDRAHRICDWAGLLEYIDQPIRTFSSGMTARFAFSLNTDLNPDILILDEVLSVGDREFQEKSLERTKYLMQGGTSVLFVSHDMNSVRNFCSKVIWMESGKVKMIGEANEVVDCYESS